MLSLTTRSSWNATCISYVCLSYCCDCEDVALENFTKYFLHQSYEKEHAKKLINLQSQQCGQIFLLNIRKPDHECSGSMHYTWKKVQISHYWK